MELEGTGEGCVCMCVCVLGGRGLRFSAGEMKHFSMLLGGGPGQEHTDHWLPSGTQDLQPPQPPLYLPSDPRLTAGLRWSTGLPHTPTVPTDIYTDMCKQERTHTHTHTAPGKKTNSLLLSE